jgi:hypothetical protein
VYARAGLRPCQPMREPGATECPGCRSTTAPSAS